MSDFTEILTRTTTGNNVWRASRLGSWIYISECWKGTDGVVRTSKSKKGNPYIFRVHEEQLKTFMDFAAELITVAAGGPANEEPPF